MTDRERLSDILSELKEKKKKRDYLNAVLDEIRTEIESQIHEEYIPCTGGYVSRTIQADVVLKIIDKYRKEQE